MIPTLRNLNYTERLRNLGLPSLEYRRERADMIQVFKMTNKIDQPSIPIITLSENNRTRGNEHKLYKKKSKTELRKNFFSNRVIDIWNELSDDVVTARVSTHLKTDSTNSGKNTL